MLPEKDHKSQHHISPYEFQEYARVMYPEVYKELMALPAPQEILKAQLLLLYCHCHFMGDDASWVFVGACLRLYSPLTLICGARVRHGLAAAIADVRGVKRAAISKIIPGVVHQYQNVQPFREDVHVLANYKEGMSTIELQKRDRS